LSGKQAPPPAVAPTPPWESEGNPYAKDVTIDLLLRRAFPHGQWAHVGEWLEQQSLAPEVHAELEASIERCR
jgi:hypothetical protein